MSLALKVVSTQNINNNTNNEINNNNNNNNNKVLLECGHILSVRFANIRLKRKQKKKK